MDILSPDDDVLILETDAFSEARTGDGSAQAGHHRLAAAGNFRDWQERASDCADPCALG